MRCLPIDILITQSLFKFTLVMTFHTFATTLNLLSTIGSGPYQESILINQLNDAIRFDHNIFLLHSSVVEVSRFVGSTGTDQVNYRPRCLFIFDDDDDHITSVQANRTSKKEFLIVAPPSSNFESNLNLLWLVKQIQLSDVANLKIGMFFPTTVSSDDLQKHFQWCWNNRIIDIFAAFGDYSGSLLQVFTFNPFGTFDVINVTGSGSFHDIFPAEYVSNFQQHSFRLAMIDDDEIVQYNFLGTFIGSPDEKVWKSVCSIMNATYTLFPVRGSLEPVEMLDNGTVDIHADLTDIMNQRILTIYPIMFEVILIVVPESEPYAAIEAYIRIITASDFFGYFSIMIVVAVLVLMVSRYINGKKCLMLQCVVDVVNLLLNENSAVKYQRLNLSEFFLVVPMTFAGFVIVNGFLSSLKSHLTRPVTRPQIDTIEELYRSPIPIMTVNEYWLPKDIEFFNALLEHGNFSSKMTIANVSDFMQRIVDDIPVAFSEYNSLAKIFCKHRKYHIAQIQTQQMQYSYSARDDFPFTDRVNEIIQRVQTAGLYDKWWNDANDYGKYFINVAATTHTDDFNVPLFIVYGWIAGFVVLVVELNWKKIIAFKLQVKSMFTN